MKDAVQELRENAALPFEKTRAMPPSVYTSEEFLARETSSIFANEWFRIGRADALSKPGN